MKKLYEKKNSLLNEMEDILNKAKEETRSFTEEEKSRVEEIKSEIRGLEQVIANEEELRSFDKSNITRATGNSEKTTEERQQEEVEKEERQFIDAVATGEIRNLTAGNNGGIIPVTIASDIIDTVKELCPLLDHADIYHVAGELRLPKFKATSSNADGVATPIAASYVNVKL